MIKIRKSLPLMLVMSCFSGSTRICGADIRDRTDVKSGTLYPILARLEEKGAVMSQWEKGDTRKLRRPLMKFYRLTPDGKRLQKQLASDLATIEAMRKIKP